MKRRVGSPIGSHQAIAAETRATQANVLELVIEERIDANGALLAFLSLSNQILAEADKRD